jgi:hypothetical protein
MFTQKWNEWVAKYGIENVLFVVRDIACMKSIKVRYGFDAMVESYEYAFRSG